MTASEFAQIADARQVGPEKWIARCKAHGDRMPSLSIGTGRDDRVLVRCFANCDLINVVRAYGLSIRDLFNESHEYKRPKQRDSRPPIVIAEEALRAEFSRVMEDEAQCLGYEPPALATYENTARARVEKRLHVKLTRRPIPWFEVFPHAVDPAWSFCVQRAIEEAAMGSDTDASWLEQRIVSLPQTRDRVLDRAAVLLHEVAT